MPRGAAISGWLSRFPGVPGAAVELGEDLPYLELGGYFSPRAAGWLLDLFSE
jgi:hypothetical protein